MWVRVVGCEWVRVVRVFRSVWVVWTSFLLDGALEVEEGADPIGVLLDNALLLGGMLRLMTATRERFQNLQGKDTIGSPVIF